MVYQAAATRFADRPGLSPTRRQRRSTNQMRSTIIIPQHKRRDARKFMWAVLARI